MKIVITQDASKSKVFSDSGKDITNELHISQIEVIAKANELSLVRLTCYIESAEIELPKKQVILEKANP